MSKVTLLRILSAGVGAIVLSISCGGDGAPAQDDTNVACESGQPAGIQQDEVEPDSEAVPVLPGVMGARHILIAYTGSGVHGILRNKEEAEALAGDIRTRIINEEISFEEAAMRYSDCTSADEGGVLPDFTEGAMVPAFENAVMALEPGDISVVIETDFGFHIIERTK